MTFMNAPFPTAVRMTIPSSLGRVRLQGSLFTFHSIREDFLSRNGYGYEHGHGDSAFNYLRRDIDYGDVDVNSQKFEYGLRRESPCPC